MQLYDCDSTGRNWHAVVSRSEFRHAPTGLGKPLESSSAFAVAVSRFEDGAEIRLLMGTDTPGKCVAQLVSGINKN